MDKIIMLIRSWNGDKFKIICFVLASFLWLFYFGCQSKVASSIDQKTKVTRAELDKEVELYLARIDEKYASLNQQDQIRKLITDNLSVFSSGGSVNTLGVLASLFSIFGVGAVADNIIYRKKVKAESKIAVTKET
jgi:hypothetical protein